MKKLLPFIVVIAIILSLFTSTSFAAPAPNEATVSFEQNVPSTTPPSPVSITDSKLEEIVWQYEHSCSCDDFSDTVIFNEVPQFYQEDYPDVRYGESTVAKCGCGVTCVAMVASYLTDHEYRPDILAKQYGLSGDSHVKRLELIMSALELPVERMVFDWLEVIDALNNGQVAIVLVDEDSVLTTSQHFIVCIGVTEDGKILIKDPSILNCDKFQYTGEFETGFEIKDVFYGFQGGWIFEKKNQQEETPTRETDPTCEEIMQCK